ncbi:MAG: ATP-binding protein [Candidatus Nomurabacteria bacterium]|jgi:predicted AAA+ superfamily ATPase|nr:ATP-binding protein [Candidatus Nomurabacteria bacterium]
MIGRIVNLEKFVKNGKTLVLYGARRTGKTTLLDKYVLENGDQKKVVKYNGDNLSVQNNFSVNDITKLGKLVDGFDVLAIDEAQNIDNIGMSLKILNDERKDLSVIVSGSSSFVLKGQVGEPLVGRKTTVFLYPLTVGEIVNYHTDKPDKIVWESLREQLMIYGFYPDSILADNDQARADFLLELVDSLLLKDILAFQDVKGSDILLKLLRLLAFQIGGEVSMEELGNTLGVSKNTAARYLDLLEQAFIVFRLDGFSRNLRSEINKKSKYYFYDIGVRNAIINNFNNLEMRDDAGQLWENLVIVERKKYLDYNRQHKNLYFWRTYEKSELDLVEEQNGKLTTFEMKWNPKKTSKLPAQWIEEYGKTNFATIHRDNLLDFVK